MINPDNIKTPIKEIILKKLEVPMNGIVTRIITEETKQYLEKTGNELVFTTWAEEMIRLSLVIDLMKSLQNYVKPTDTLETLNWNEGSKGIEISANILREGVSYNFFTEAIYAGGYHIQRLHLRYLTKTKMPRITSDLAKEYQEKYKSLNKIDRLEQEIETCKIRIKKSQDKINLYSPMNRKELIEEIKKNPTFGWRFNRNWENIDKDWYKGTKEDFDKESEELIEDGIVQFKKWNIELQTKYITSDKNTIMGIQTKISKIII
tara:strand:- start:942 stop:1730 length:789 start_codon:yes stop_codon:yes gene_type:complete